MWERVTTGCQTISDPCLAATIQGGTGTEVTVQVSLEWSGFDYVKTRPLVQNYYESTAALSQFYLLKVRSKRQVAEGNGKTEGYQIEN